MRQSQYEETKDYYVPRTLQLNIRRREYNEDAGFLDDDTYLRYEAEYLEFTNKTPNSVEEDKFSTLTLINYDHFFKKRQRDETCDVILIIDAPGMGKSTLLTHLCLKTKKQYPKIWIQRINLINYTKQFHEWQKKKIEIDIVEILKFLCKVILSKEGIVHVSHTSNIDLRNVNGYYEFTDRKEISALEVFELDTFLHCFNKGRTVFLFDGFDEISPRFTREVMQLIKNLARRRLMHGLPGDGCEQKLSEQCIWITCRPYNNLTNTLEEEFGESYTIEPFSYKLICVFLDKYMRRNLDISTLTRNQHRNIHGFLEYSKQFYLYDGSTNLPIDNLLHSVHLVALEYFKKEIRRVTSTADSLKSAGYEDIKLEQLEWPKPLRLKAYVDFVTLLGVPLHTYIGIQYFQYQINNIKHTDIEEIVKQWDLDTNAFEFYDLFLKTKLKTIRFEEKNRMNMSIPDVEMMYEKEKREFLDKHKKLAFYGVGDKEVFTSNELDQVEEIIRRMENGEEKTGLVDRIVDGEPKFVHYTFAEYFTVEYIADCLKSSAPQQRMLGYILRSMFIDSTPGVLKLFDRKIKSDFALRDAITYHVKRSICKILGDESNRGTRAIPITILGGFVGGSEKITILDQIAHYIMPHFVTLLIDTAIGMIDETNFFRFNIYFRKELQYFKKPIISNYDEIAVKLLNCIKRFDASIIA